jgi:hypothetical protein
MSDVITFRPKPPTSAISLPNESVSATLLTFAPKAAPGVPDRVATASQPATGAAETKRFAGEVRPTAMHPGLRLVGKLDIRALARSYQPYDSLVVFHHAPRELREFLCSRPASTPVTIADVLSMPHPLQQTFWRWHACNAAATQLDIKRAIVAGEAFVQGLRENVHAFDAGRTDTADRLYAIDKNNRSASIFLLYIAGLLPGSEMRPNSPRARVSDAIRAGYGAVNQAMSERRIDDGLFLQTRHLLAALALADELSGAPRQPLAPVKQRAFIAKHTTDPVVMSALATIDRPAAARFDKRLGEVANPEQLVADFKANIRDSHHIDDVEYWAERLLTDTEPSPT